MSGARRWLVSPAFDLGWFLGPGLLALVVATIIGLRLPPAEDDSFALWIVGVLLVDVAHVWASLYRTYLDADARVQHRGLLTTTPIVVAVVGFWAHAISDRLFWGVLAYVAVFHFIKQQEGFVALYLRAGGQVETWARRLSKWSIWAVTAGPVIWWHTRLPRRFAWFRPDDFVAGLPELVGTLAVWLQVPVLLAFAGVWLGKQNRAGHVMVPLLIGLTALSWNLGIVWFDDGRVFTLTNVFIHGVPYLALVWVAGGRERVRGSLPRAGVVTLALVFYGVLAALAFAEEALWDRLVWHDHEALFGEGTLSLDEFALALVVTLLTLPQATHYVLDRFIWRVGPRNPKLARQLGLASLLACLATLG
jgi:hypothetical protein